MSTFGALIAAMSDKSIGGTVRYLAYVHLSLVFENHVKQQTWS